jgi:hypothetical protein
MIRTLYNADYFVEVFSFTDRVNEIGDLKISMKLPGSPTLGEGQLLV